MNRNSEFAYTFGDLAGIIKFSIVAQGIAGLFLIWFFILPNIGESVDLGNVIYFFISLLALLGGAVFFLVLMFIFSASLKKLKRFRKSFGILSVFGCIACVLPVAGSFYLAGVSNSYIMYIVSAMIGMAILAIKPVYYELMRREVSERVSPEYASRWRNLLIIDFAFILLCAVAYVFFIMQDMVLNSGGAEQHQQVSLRVTLTITALIAAAVLYCVRLAVEYRTTSVTADIL